MTDYPAQSGNTVLQGTRARRASQRFCRNSNSKTNTRDAGTTSPALDPVSEYLLETTALFPNDIHSTEYSVLVVIPKSPVHPTAKRTS